MEMKKVREHWYRGGKNQCSMDEDGNGEPHLVMYESDSVVLIRC